MNEFTIAGVILAKNEQLYIAKAINSLLKVVPTVYVGDMNSVDQTVKIAMECGAKIIKCDDNSYIDYAKDLLIEKICADIIILLDADEVIDANAVIEGINLINEGKADAVRISRQIYIKNKKIIGLGWQNDSVVRIFKKGKVSHSKNLHTQPKVNGIEVTLTKNEGIIHHYWANSYQDIIRKHSTYLINQADSIRVSSNISKKFYIPFFYFIKEFLSRYLKSYGFLNGSIGFDVSILMAIDRYKTHLLSME